MLAASAVSQSASDTLSGPVLVDAPKLPSGPGWSVARVVPFSAKVHGLSSLRGVGHPPDWVPIFPGCDAGDCPKESITILDRSAP
jgi:hypothetical protein